MVSALRAPAEPCAEQLTLFELGVDMAKLRMEAARLRAAVRSPNTERAYASSWRDFEGWCASVGRSALPATPETVVLYMVAERAAGRTLSSIEMRLAAIADRHRAAGHRPPTVDDDVHVVYGGLRRELGTAPPNAKAPLTVPELRRCVRACGLDLRGVRDRAVLLFGFASALRRGELAGLDLADVRFERRGVLVRLGRSKTDPEGAGRELGVNRAGRLELCPVRALRAWVRVRGDWPGPLFCPIGRNTGTIEQRRLRGAAIAAVVKWSARAAGLDPARFAGHSLRAGCATAAGETGMSALEIQRRTGHASLAMVGRYVRSAFALDPLRRALA